MANPKQCHEYVCADDWPVEFSINFSSVVDNIIDGIPEFVIWL